MGRTGAGGFSKLAAAAAVALATWHAGSADARGAVAHVVQPGETLWSISMASNLTTRTVAVFNGLSEDAYAYAGQTIMVPTVEEGAATLAQAGVLGTPSQTASQPTPAAEVSPTAWMGHIPSPWGELHLDPRAAEAWNAMRQEALASWGVDLYPDGPLSAYRSYAEQAQMYQAYLAGTGPMAAPPGTSAHELGLAVDLAEPIMRDVIDQIGAAYGWAKTEAPDEWWHVNYVGG